MASLSDKLKSLGVKIGLAEIKSASQSVSAAYSVASVIDGVWLDTIFGKTYRMDQFFPMEYIHGDTHLSLTSPLGFVGEWAHIPSADTIPVEKIYFLDTETSGLSGGTGTFAFLIGIGHFTSTGFAFSQFFLQDPSSEPALLAALNEYMTDCQVLVTFNGKSFDVPILATRYGLNRIESPMKGIFQLDMLPLSRRLWKNRLPSRRLSYLENILLGVNREEDEVPGYLISQYYFDYLHTQDARPLKGVFYHNTIDVISLAALLSFVLEILDHPADFPPSDTIDLIAVARLMEDLGYTQKAIELYETGLNSLENQEEFYRQALERLSHLYRRQNQTEKAIQKWEAGFSAGDLTCAIELSKYYEHTRRDYDQARLWVIRAHELVDQQNYSSYLRKQILADLQHREDRIDRLRRKNHPKIT